jgi:hypothetical protein
MLDEQPEGAASRGRDGSGRVGSDRQASAHAMQRDATAAGIDLGLLGIRPASSERKPYRPRERQ